MTPMRKIAVALTAALILLAAPGRGGKPAEAACRIDCPAWLDAFGWTLAAGLVAGYAGGTGYFIYRDATDAAQSSEYAIAELGLNGVFGSLFVAGTVGAIEERQYGQLAVYGPLALTHGALAAHGGWRAWQHRGEVRMPAHALEALAGVAYTTNALIWTSQLGAHHGTAYGIAEAAVNAPVVAGLGYLAADRMRAGDLGYAALFGGLAAVSSALVVHGVYTAAAPHRASAEPIDFGLDLGLGAEVAPTVVSDGKAVGPGVGASGTW